jgi:hypothetical protein
MKVKGITATGKMNVKYISKTNPMESIKEKKDKTEKDDVSEMMDSLSSMSGMLSV